MIATLFRSLTTEPTLATLRSSGPMPTSKRQTSSSQSFFVAHGRDASDRQAVTEVELLNRAPSRSAAGNKAVRGQTMEDRFQYIDLDLLVDQPGPTHVTTNSATAA
jgi:hypothetical protein